MRGSFDALAGAVRRLGLDPVDGHLYLFLNKRRPSSRRRCGSTAQAGVSWRSGSKRAASSFQLPPFDEAGSRVEVDGNTFAAIIAGIDFTAARRGWFRRPTSRGGSTAPPPAPKPPETPPSVEGNEKVAFESRPKPPPLPLKTKEKKPRPPPTGRNALPKHLPLEEHSLKPNECGRCGSTALDVADVVEEEKLHVVNEHQRRLVVKRTTCRCRACGEPHDAALVASAVRALEGDVRLARLAGGDEILDADAARQDAPRREGARRADGDGLAGVLHRARGRLVGPHRRAALAAAAGLTVDGHRWHGPQGARPRLARGPQRLHRAPPEPRLCGVSVRGRQGQRAPRREAEAILRHPHRRCRASSEHRLRVRPCARGGL